MSSDDYIKAMFTTNNIKSQLHYDHDLTELSWLTRPNIFHPSSTSTRQRSFLIQSFTSKHDEELIKTTHRHSSPTNILDSSDSEQDVDSSSLNSSSERVGQSSNDLVSPPHSALCFWILFAIEDSSSRTLTLNEICDWIEKHVEQQKSISTTRSIAFDEQCIHSTRLKSKVRYHMTKQISFFIKILHDPFSGIKLRYPLWTVDRSKRSLLLDTLLTMTTRQLSLSTPYTIEIYERLCTERRRALIQQMNDENSCPNGSFSENPKREKLIHRLGSCDESTNSTSTILTNCKRKKQQSKLDSTNTNELSVEVVDAALTLLLLKQPKSGSICVGPE